MPAGDNADARKLAPSPCMDLRQLGADPLLRPERGGDADHA